MWNLSQNFLVAYRRDHETLENVRTLVSAEGVRLDADFSIPNGETLPALEIERSIHAEEETAAAVEAGKEAAVHQAERLERAHQYGAHAFVPAVMEHPFIMHQPGVIQLAEQLGHFIDYASPKGLIPTRPDQDRRVVLIPLIAGVHTVQHHRLPFLPIPWNGCFHACHPLQDQGFPGSVAFQIVLSNHIQPIFVAKRVNAGVIGVVAGPYGIDIITLHGDNILQDFPICHCTPCLRAKFMAVYAFKHDPFPV